MMKTTSASLNLRDIVCVELMQMFQKEYKEYWSRLWIIQELTVSCMTSTVHWGESTFQLSTLRTIADILRTHSETLNSEIWKNTQPGLDILAFSTFWIKSEAASGDTEHSLDDASMRELSLLAARASCSLQHDRVYALLGLFPLSVSSIVTIDYNREAAEVVEEFNSAVPQWRVPAVGDKPSVPTGEG
jgi:hypothetical protein